MAADTIYTSFKTGLSQAGFNLASDSLKAMLVTSSYAPSAAHSHRSDVTNEVVGAGYTLGGVALAGLSVSAVGTTSKFTASNASWAASTITARGVVVYKVVGSAATDTLIAYLDFGSDIISTADTFTIAWNASGILVLS